jgi:hypothetical protein
MAPSSVNIAASKRGAIPTIACINKTTVDLGVEFDRLIAALQEYVDRYLAPVWATPAKLVSKRAPDKHAWTMVFFDSATAEDVKDLGIPADPRNVLGRHKLEHHGLPLAMVFVKSTLDAGHDVPDGDKIGMAASHELAEMLVDPGNNLWCELSEGVFCAYEVCDAVEDQHFAVHGIAMSDFVYPAYFGAFRNSKSVQFDYMKKVKRPFQILKGGYLPVKQRGSLKLMFGSADKKRAFDAEDRHLHRIGLRTEVDNPRRVRRSP